MVARIVVCPACGTQLDVSEFASGSAVTCGSCGRPVRVAATPASPAPVRGNSASGRAAARSRGLSGRGRSRSQGVPNHLVLAILTALFCCQIGGIIAIVYAIQANSLAGRGHADSGRRSADAAKLWITISIVSFFVILAVVLAMWQQIAPRFR